MIPEQTEPIQGTNVDDEMGLHIFDSRDLMQGAQDMPSRRPKKKKQRKRDHGGQSGHTREAEKGSHVKKRNRDSYSTSLGLQDKHDLVRDQPNCHSDT